MKSSKYILIAIALLAGHWTQAQDVNTVVQRYQAAIADIETIYAQVEQLDTFVTGTVWQHQGQLTMLRNRADTLFGFHYRASKGVGGEALYDGLSAFEIDHDKQAYELNAYPQAYILGSPGGQLVIPELLNDQDPDVTPELTETDQHFVLRYAYPDLEEYDVRQREKTIFLDKTTFLPVKVIKRQVSLGKKQVITRILSAVRINRPEDRQAFQKDFLSSYKMITEDPLEDLHADLLETLVKDFQLTTFAGGRITTQPQAGKLLLLDFWEVWCGPCIASMPKVQALADQYGAQGLEVVGVLMDPDSQESAERLISKRGITFTQALGNPELRAYFRVFAVPQYVLIDQDGIIRHVFLGYSKKLEKQIKLLLAANK
jgi:thiol-disulfide isomerase/thioredoxin